MMRALLAGAKPPCGQANRHEEHDAKRIGGMVVARPFEAMAFMGVNQGGHACERQEADFLHGKYLL